MSRRALVLYLIEGLPVGKIADDLGESRPTVRQYLRESGLSIRPVNGVYLMGRDSVCDAVKRAGFSSFHEFAQARGLDPLIDQTNLLGISEKALARVYGAYRKLLTSLKTAGIILPTSQTRGVELDQQSAEDRPS